jgi:hypothetical protein
MSIILLMAYNFFFGSAEPPMTSVDSDSATKQTGSVEKPFLSDSMSFKRFAEEVAVSKQADLAGYLERTNKLGPIDERVPARIERNRRRVKAAEQLLKLDCTDEEYELAIKAKLRALSSIYNTAMDSGFQIEVTEDADELRKFSQSVSSDGDEEIRLDARLTIAGIDLIESAKLAEKEQAPEQAADQNAKSIRQLLNDFPDNSKVTEYLQSVFPVILKTSPSFAEQLTEKLLAFSDDFKQGHQAELLRSLYDLTKITSADTRNKMENVFVGGEDAKQELISIAREFASDVSGGASLINELEILTNWMESVQEYATALEIYQLLLESASKRSTTELVNMAERAARHGKARCELVGKKIELRGERLAGGQLAAEQFEGNFVVVLFLTFERLNAEALLNEIAGELENLANRRVKFIAVTLDKSPDPAFNELALRFPAIEFLKLGAEDADPPSIHMQYPAHIIPQAILISPDGVLIRTAIKPLEINHVVNEELIKSEQR